MLKSNKEHIVNNINQTNTSTITTTTTTLPLTKAAYAKRVRDLNDQLRKFGKGGMVVMTGGIAAHEVQAVNDIFKAIAAYDAFTDDNDPWGEHDCAVLTAIGVKVMFKIDYFDRSRTFHSPNPADPKVTTRVMTVMLADEY